MKSDVDIIIVKIKCKPKYHLLNVLRDQGLLFDTLREALECDDDGLQEISWEEYKILENTSDSKKQA